MNFYAIKNLFKTTKKHAKYWRERKADWKTSYLDTFDHPHRKLIVGILKDLPWISLFEIGCNSAPNLKAIVQALPGKQVGGCDVNAEAIELAQKTFTGGVFKVSSADEIMMSDKSVDIVLSDMALIYSSPRDIDKFIIETKRIARNYILFCEFHSDSWWNRLALKFNSGYNAFNYDKLLKKHGFYDVLFYKLKESDWPGGNPQKTFAYLILAKVPKN